MPSKTFDRLVNGAKISVTRWRVLDSGKLRFLVDAAYDGWRKCEYNLSAPTRAKQFAKWRWKQSAQLSVGKG